MRAGRQDSSAASKLRGYGIVNEFRPAGQCAKVPTPVVVEQQAVAPQQVAQVVALEQEQESQLPFAGLE
jgi:hypothetical protein